MEDRRGSLWREQNCTSTMFSRLLLPLLACHLDAMDGSTQATARKFVHLVIIPLFRSLLWPSSDFLFINRCHFASKVMSQFGDFWLTLVVLIDQLLLSLFLVSVLMKLRQSTIWGLWAGSGFFFLLQTICQHSKWFSCGWLKQNKSTYKKSLSEKYVLISGKNSFHFLFSNCTFKTFA